jgi:hypothetical protein
VCYAAAIKGHLNCLKYAHEQGCPWNVARCARDALVWSLAANNPCFAYMLCHGCDMTKTTILEEPDVLMRCSDIDIALILYIAGASCLPADSRLISKIKNGAAIVNKVRLIRRMKDAYRHAATRIQRFWKLRMYRPGGAGMISASKRFYLMSDQI